MGFVKRLLDLWGPKLSSIDYDLLETYLDEPGKFLFFQMNKADQAHSIAVAKMVISQAGFIRGLNHTVLVKAALLHDIGKVEGDLSAFSRLIVGIIRRIRPSWREKLAEGYRNGLRTKIRYGSYVDINHPARGSHMAKILGIEEAVVSLIRHHHDPPHKDQEPELTWLQLADSKN